MRTAYVVAPEADAADAVQDAFVKAYGALAALPRRRADPAVAAPHRRQRGTQSAALGGSTRGSRAPGRRGLDPSDELAPSPESAVLADETRGQLLAALGRLRDEEREVIGARYFLGLSEAETAESLSIPAGTVKSRTARALGHLRVALGELEGGPLDG